MPEEFHDQLYSDDLATFVGQDAEARQLLQYESALRIVTEMARAYTRGRGFDQFGQPTRAIGAVVTTATARLVANPHQIPQDVGVFSIRGGWQGWNLTERMVLDRYRKKAA